MPKSWTLLAIGIGILAAAPSDAQQKRRPPELSPLPARLATGTFERFAGDNEFRRYLRDVKREALKRDVWWSALRKPVQVAQTSPQEAPCLKPEDCPKDDSPKEIVVTGSRAVSAPVSVSNAVTTVDSVSANPNITNVQSFGVDEGDIVKQAGPYLLVLQDGRIFTIDTRQQGLKLVDRTNVYRDKDSDTWYDEMLVQGDHIIITGYSYDEQASEVSVFRISQQGRLSSEGVFLISSNDYYDSDNYATRLVGDKLVIYTPLDLTSIDPEKPFVWPVVRRWLPEDERDDAKDPGKPLFDASKIYKPVRTTIDPTVHTMSVCPIGPVRKGRAMECTSTAVVAPSGHVFYVTPTDFYLWAYPGWNEYDRSSWDSSCKEWSRRGPADAHPSIVFRMPLSGGEPTALGVKGVPIDQFSFLAASGRLRVLSAWEPIRCDGKKRDDDDDAADLKLLDAPLSALTDSPDEARPGAYTPLPAIGTDHVQNRYTDKYLVYAGGARWGNRPPYDESEGPVTAKVVAVPLRAPRTAAAQPLSHGVARLERLGNDAILTGYRDQKGLNVSILDLRTKPSLKPPVLLERRYESEGRSHAFNSAIWNDGHGLFGIPTVKGDDEEGRWWWRSGSSDVSFFSVDTDRNAGHLGELIATEGDKATDPSYKCEVSCIDWYGNSRPIFTGGRIFGLSGTELIEGKQDGQRIVEVRRLNLTQPVAANR